MSIVENDGDARRARASTRIPFDGVVEVGAELGPPFAAQAVDVSDGGMHLRTAYLPEVGQTLSCRFEAGREQVIATGEVVWQRDAGRGGEFGLRFIDLDPESAAALERMTDRARIRVPGARVRLHIDGLGAPMRARVKGASPHELKVGSELGFLQVGKHLDLEDAESGHRRPASIDRVEVEIDASSRVPQLVVALKYEDVEDDMKAAADEGGIPPHDGMDVDPHAQTMHAHDAHAEGAAHPEYAHDPDPMHAHDDLHAEGHDDGMHGDDVDVSTSDPMHGDAHAQPSARAMIDEDAEESMRMKGPVARAASKVTPALERFAKRTKTTAMLLVERARARRMTESSPIRRTTAPPPGGSLHTAGRKVVRSEPIITDRPVETRMASVMANKKKLTMIGAGGIAVLAIGVALVAKKPAAPPPATADTAANAAPADGTNAATATNAATTTPAALPNAAAPIGATPAPAAAPVTPAPGPATVEIASGTSATDPVMADKNPVGDSDAKPAKKMHLKVTPFTNGAVSRGNLLRLKMDGTIEKIEGAPQPTGFTVHIPGHRSLEPAAPLAARDARIGSIKVVNDPAGAELSVTFKDGVPNYAVRAKGDQLEIVLASPGAPLVKDEVATNAKPAGHKKEGRVAKHGKHKHNKH